MLRRRMGLTYVSATFIGPRGRRALRVLVDSGASYSMISGSIARELGAQELEPVELELADGKTMVRRLCELRVEAAGRTAWTVVAMGRRGDAPILGVHALESLRLELDPVRRRLRPLRRAKLVALLPSRGVAARVS